MTSILYTHATITTVNAKREIYQDGSILVKDNLIADIGPSSVLIPKYPDVEVYNLKNHIIIPGLISTHMHCVQSLFRGTADDCDLITWMCDRIWVTQGSILPEEVSTYTLSSKFSTASQIHVSHLKEKSLLSKFLSLPLF
jgi:cytosine/adenosine deaminase-related metal-dependent hydrolase